jgi:Putative amidase domain
MLQNWYKTKVGQLLSIILIFVFIFVSVAAILPSIAEKSASEAAISKYQATQLNPSLSDEEKIKSAIDAYLTTRYEGQKTLKTQDFSALMEDNAQSWVKKEQDKRDIELNIANLFGLQYVSYKYTLNYSSITIKNGQAVVQLSESHDVVFRATAPVVSKLANLQHTITLRNKNGTWLIYKDEYKDELSSLLVNKTKDEIIQQVNQNHQDDLLRISASNSTAEQTPSMISPLLTNYSYNRTAAVNYANTYYQNYNTAYYVTQSEDCTDFVSQAMYAGEGKTPPDTSGMATASNRSYNYDWYYVWSNSGSLPWIRVQDQYNFVTGANRGNTGVGPYGTGSTNLCSTQKGDIVQLYNADGTGSWDHEGILEAVPSQCSAGLSQFLIDAHTTNRAYYPLSYWSSYQMRYILISGWSK